MPYKDITFTQTHQDSLGRNGFVRTHGTRITLFKEAEGEADFPGEVWFEPITSRGPTDACRVVVATAAIDELIAALLHLKAEQLGTPDAEFTRVLIVSSAHLPEAYADQLLQTVFDAGGAAAAFGGFYGLILWAPYDPDEHDFGDMPESVQLILRHARNLGCTHVIFDQDGEALGDFETYEPPD